MSAIIAGIIAALMLFGAIIPNYTNNALESSLRNIFNNPEKMEVKVYSTPSFKILTGNYDRIEISAVKPEFEGLQFDSIVIYTSPLKIDSSKLPAEDLSFIEKGKLETLLVLSPDNLAKFIDLDSIKTRFNNLLSTFDLPIPMLSGNVSVDNLDIIFQNNKPTLSGNLIALGGFITLPFSVSGELTVNNNALSLIKPQFTVSGQPLIFEQIQDLTRFINPIYDFKNLSDENMTITVNKLNFVNNKMRLTGLAEFK